MPAFFQYIAAPSRWKVVFIFALLSALTCPRTLAQEPARRDTIPSPFDSLGTPRADTLRKAGGDSLRVDSLRADSLTAKKDSSSSGIDSVVTYTATDSVIYSISTRSMSMYSKGDVKYKDMRLTADRIDVNWKTSVLNAFPYPDSLRKDSVVKGPSKDGRADTAKQRNAGAPIMKDGKEEYHGHELSYNFRTKKGRIDVGETTIDQGYYHGEDIKKVGSDVLFVEDGRYTTCDLPEPHYYFSAPKMKVMMQDKVVAEPVYLYIADVPIFALPFAVFPNKGGRRSGIIAPAYGEDNRGRYLRHVGYYWATNEYMDLAASTDLYTKGGWSARADYRYALMYNFTGSLSGEYRKIIVGEDNDPNKERSSAYNLNLTHRQTIDPTTNLDANLTFASRNNYQNTIDLAQALQQEIASNATLSRSWEGTPNSISLSVSRQQNLKNGNLDQVLPSVNFSHSQSYPFRHDQSYDEGSTDLQWYENIGFSYNASANSRYTRTSQVSNSSLKVKNATEIGFDPAGIFRTDRSQALSQNASLLIAPKLGYFTITPQLSYSDQRSVLSSDIPFLDSDSTGIGYRTDRAWTRAGTVSSGISADTRLYGIIQPNMLGVAAFRHTMQPSLYLAYTKQVIGENLPPKQLLLGFNLGNIFEMKTIAPEGKEPDRVTLLNLSTGISYNLAADSLRLSSVPVNFRTNIGNFLGVDGGLNYDLYQLVPDANGNYHHINRFETRNGRLARLTSVRFSFSTSLSGERRSSNPATGGSSGDTTTTHNVRSGYVGLYENEEPDFNIPWNLSLAMDYSETKDPPVPSRAVNLRGDLGFSLTQNWKVTASGSYDVTNKQFAAPNINISRDLHCWLMNFSWIPTGNYRHYQFEIKVKAPQLQDIKVTKSGADYDLR